MNKIKNASSILMWTFIAVASIKGLYEMAADSVIYFKKKIQK